MFVCQQVKEIADHQIKVEREAEEKKRDEAGHSFSVFPPFPPPPQSGSGVKLTRRHQLTD